MRSSAIASSPFMQMADNVQELKVVTDAVQEDGQQQRTLNDFSVFRLEFWNKFKVCRKRNCSPGKIIKPRFHHRRKYQHLETRADRAGLSHKNKDRL